MPDLNLLKFGAAVTLALLLFSLYYMYRDVEKTKPEQSQIVRLQDPSHVEQHSFEGKEPGSWTDERERQSLPDDHPDLVFMRTFGRVKNLPTADQVKMMTDKEIMYIYHSYLDNTDFSCRRKLRMGKVDDGGWDVCDDFPYRPIKPCVVYSFGIQNEFSFDDDVAGLYGCTVYSFDPSMNVATHQRSKKVLFYNLGISSRNGDLGDNRASPSTFKDWHVKTLTEIKAMLHHQDTIVDILKMDIEQSEWIVLQDLLQQGELTKVRQLLVEFHHLFDPSEVRFALPVLQKLEAAGFRRFHSNINAHGPERNDVYPVMRHRCYEVYFVNMHLMRKP